MSIWEWHERWIWALTVWREASNQPYSVRVQVAHCIKNRADRPSWWGRNVVEVCTKLEQFTSMNTKQDDPNLRRWPQLNDKAFEECVDIVSGLQKGFVVQVFKGADSYYDNSIPTPWWAKQYPERHVGDAGAFHFYNMDIDVEDPVVPIKETEA